MEFKFGNLIFSSKFDSGNLSSVEQVTLFDDNCNNQYLPPIDTENIEYEFNVWTKPDCMGTVFENSNRTWFYFSVKGYVPDKMIKITIKNLNRHQRLYGQGYCPLFKTDTNNPENDKWFRIPYKPTWSADSSNFQLSFTHHLSDIQDSVTYFAFCYPWSYTDCQKQLIDLDFKFRNIDTYSWKMLSKMNPRTIYYKRELLSKSLEDRRIDLMTITDLDGLCKEREEKFDDKLFPENKSRPWKFKDKKVFIVTSRVHPGETPSSHVFNGFLNFILRPDDPRSLQLRRQFIFKLIPLLNPDGVFRGHYRTDSRGVNLNRVYLNPSFKLHPSIFAAKSLLVYHHIYNSTESKDLLSAIKSCVYNNFKDDSIPNEMPPNEYPNVATAGLDSRRNSMAVFKRRFDVKDYQKTENRTEEQPINDDCFEVVVDTETLANSKAMTSKHIENPQKLPNECKKPDSDETIHDARHLLFVDDDDQGQKQSIYRFVKPSNRSNSIPALSDKEHHQWNLKGHHATLFNCAGLKSPNVNNQTMILPQKQPNSMIPVPVRPSHMSMLPFIKKYNNISVETSQVTSVQLESQSYESYEFEDKIGNEASDDDTGRDCSVAYNEGCSESLHLRHPMLLELAAEKSGIAFYIDLHGHCSKRGCFVYGNYLELEDHMIDNLLYPKLISLNSAHFDFLGCNFSLRNMYTKDVKDGTSKEGAGRVATWKHLGLVHCYTLECNYNTGRTINTIPRKSKEDGKVSPPSAETICLLPPKYTPFHFEDVGKGMAIAALDMFQTNPCSRIINSEYVTLRNVRLYIRRYMTNQNIGFGRSVSLSRRKSRKTKQLSTNSISLTSKTGSMSLITTRKSQSSAAQNITNNNVKGSTLMLSNVIYSNFHQEDLPDNETYVEKKVTNENSTRRSMQNIASAISIYDDMINIDNRKAITERPPSSKQNVPVLGQQIINQSFKREDIPHLAISYSRPSSTNKCFVEIINYNQNNSAVIANNVETFTSSSYNNIKMGKFMNSKIYKTNFNNTDNTTDETQFNNIDQRLCAFNSEDCTYNMIQKRATSFITITFQYVVTYVHFLRQWYQNLLDIARNYFST